MLPISRARKNNESGAVAVIFAISAVMIFAFAALSVDLGNSWARTRASQTQADLAALAGGNLLPKGDSANQQAIADEVADYLNKNRISPDQPTVTGTQLLAGNNPVTGWIEFPTDNQLRVVAPQSRVDFGVAAAIGHSSTEVSTEATVEKRALDPTPDRVLPMWLPSTCVYGPVEGDTSPTTTTPLTASPAYNPASQGFQEDSKFRVTDVSVKTAAYGSTTGSIQVTIQNDDSADIGTPSAPNTNPNRGAIIFTFGQPTSWSPPTTVYPVNLDVPGKQGTTPGKQVVTISGVSTEVTSTVGMWEVWAVKNVSPSTKIPAPGTGTGASVFSADEGSNKAAVEATQTDPAVFTVTGGGGEVACTDSERGNFGQVDSPRSGFNMPNAYAYNLALGLDHKLDRFDPSVAMSGGTDLNLDPECRADGNPKGAMIDSVVRNGNNCIYVQSGNDPPGLTAGLLNPRTGAPPGRLFSKDTSPLCTGDKAAPVKPDDSKFNWSQINRDTLSCFLKPGVKLEDIAKDGADFDLLDESIKESPRFFYVPIVYSVDRADKKYIAIKQFAPVFLTDEAVANCTTPNKSCATAENGIEMNTGGTQVFAVQVFAFNDNAVPVDPNDDDSEWYPGGRPVVRLVD